MINELDTVTLLRDIPDYGLEAGDIGAVVHAYSAADVYEVEFVGGEGDTVAVLTLSATDVRPMLGNEILHARVLEPAL